MKLTIGSRGSQLALWQSEWAKAKLASVNPDLEIEVQVIKTTGDANLAASFSEIGSKGVFTKEVDAALLAGETDFSVHSLKDLPTTLPDGLSLTAVSPREDVRDALCSDGRVLSELPEGARVATSSLRRQALLRSMRADIELLPLRGNVDTRLRKLTEDDRLDAIVLAAAGLRRLGLERNLTEALDPGAFTPAAAQGVMGIVSRTGDQTTNDLLQALEDASSRAAVTAERTALGELGGGCKIPFGAWARVVEGGFVLDGVVAHPETGHLVRASIEGDEGEAEEMGKSLAEVLKQNGADHILREVLDA